VLRIEHRHVGAEREADERAPDAAEDVEDVGAP